MTTSIADKTSEPFSEAVWDVSPSMRKKNECTCLIRFFAAKDSTTRVMLEGILAVEEEHATDMHDLPVAHQGRPFIAD